MIPTTCMGNLQRTNEYPGQGVRAFHGVRWQYQANGRIWFPPLPTHETLFFADWDIYALDMQEGTERWKTSETWFSSDFSTPFRSGALTNDTLYISIDGDSDVALYGLSLLDGHIVSCYGSSTDDVIRFPSIVQDLLIGANGWMVYAYDPLHQRFRWKVEGPFSDTPPAFDEQLQSVYVSDYFEPHHHYGGLHAFDLHTGQLLWEVGSGDGFDLDPNPPLVLGSRVYMTGLATDGDERVEFVIYAFDTRTGQESWRYTETFCGSPSGLAASQGKLYYDRRSPKGEKVEICALDSASQQLLWAAPVEKDLSVAPVLADGVLYAATVEGTLHSFDLATGTRLWTFTTQQALEYSDWPQVSCCVAGQMVFFQAANTIYALY